MSGTSVPQLPSCIPFPIAEEQLLDVVAKAKDWALMHGAGMRSKNNFNPNIMQVSELHMCACKFRGYYSATVKILII